MAYGSYLASAAIQSSLVDFIETNLGVSSYFRGCMTSTRHAIYAQTMQDEALLTSFATKGVVKIVEMGCAILRMLTAFLHPFDHRIEKPVDQWKLHKHQCMLLAAKYCSFDFVQSLFMFN